MYSIAIAVAVASVCACTYFFASLAAWQGEQSAPGPLRELEAKALTAHQQHSSSLRQMGPTSPQATGSGKVTQGNEASVPVSLSQQGQSNLATEASSSQAAADVNLIHGDMEDVSLSDSPKIFRAKSTGYSKMP